MGGVSEDFDAIGRVPKIRVSHRGSSDFLGFLQSNVELVGTDGHA